MARLVRRCCLLSGLACAAFLEGCGASSTAGIPAAMSPIAHAVEQVMPGVRSGDAGVPACATPRRDEARCLVLVVGERSAPRVSGWAPADFQARYELPSRTKGAGQIVAIVDAYDNPNVVSDLAEYRSEFGLGAANFEKYNQRGERKNYPSGSTAWGVEIDLDVEMVSAVCPLCTIYLIEANSAGGSDLERAEAEGVRLSARIATNSWVCSGSASCVDRRYFDHPGVAYLAAGGDSGFNELGAPAAFDSVAAIGGTVLSKTGSKYSETIWDGSGGGCAMRFKKPRWQHDTFCTHRLLNDAAAAASKIAEYDSYGYAGWLTVDGTSAAAPLLAGVFGLAGNGMTQNGGGTFWQPRHHKFLHRIGGSCHGYSDGQYSACGGWGSPKGIGAF